ncbi:hypothetical protein BJX99DRAFT_229213 [Aspergillus californicus]
MNTLTTSMIPIPATSRTPAPSDIEAAPNGTGSHGRKPRFTATTTTYPSNSLNFMKNIPPAHNAHNAINSDNQTSSVQARLKLDILVVGAGLGGLATATALARSGHKVTVVEQANEIKEVGAGIQIPPNSSKLLARWGVMSELGGQAVEPDGMSFRRWSSGERIGFTDLSPEFRDAYGAPYYVVHRAHLHSALLKRATDLGVTIHLASRVVAYDTTVPSVSLVDGSTIQADIVIAADGIKSIARNYVSHDMRATPKPTGFAVYRATVDVEKLREIPEISWILEKPALNIWIGEDRHVMTYTIAAGQSFNMVLSHRDESDPSQWGDLSQDRILQDMTAEFAGWDPELCKIIALIDSALKWPLIGGNTLDSWVSQSSKLVILGDAAHAMVPYMSQGAAMAVEDAAALAVALSRISSLPELKFALRIFETERQERTSMMQEASMVNAMLWHFPDGPEQQARDTAMRPEVNGRHFLSSPNQWSDPLTQSWAYGYDAEEVLRKKWDRAIRDLIVKQY